MRIDHILDEVFSTWSHIAILRIFMDASHPLSGREIARLSHMNHRSCLHALTRLEHIGFVNRNRGGRDHLFSINREHRLWNEGVLPLLEIERRHLGRVAKRLRKELLMHVESAILYGNSILKQDTHDPSVDLCIVMNNKITEKEIRSHLNIIAPILWKRYGVRLHAVVLTEADFARKAKRRQAPLPAILEDGQVITGKTLQELLQ
jgi:hypothetical protein